MLPLFPPNPPREEERGEEAEDFEYDGELAVIFAGVSDEDRPLGEISRPL